MSVRQDFRTNDLYFAAYLKATGLPFEGTVKRSGCTYFIFDNHEDMRQKRNDFFSRRGKVSALDYADELRALKKLCHGKN